MKNDILKTICYIGILLIICIVSFLIAKYIVRAKIKTGDMPVDTSVRLR